MSIEIDKISYIGADFSVVWDRITNETDVNYLKDLANIVGVTQQNISLRKKENLFPYGWAYLVGRKYGLLTEWILTGIGPKRLESESNYKFPILHHLDSWLSEVVINEPERRDWFTVAIRDTFPMFDRWLKRKEADESEDTPIPNQKIA